MISCINNLNRKVATRIGKYGQSIGFGIKTRLEVRSEGVQGEFLSERRGKVIPCRGAEDRKGVGTNIGMSRTRNLETDSIRSRAERTGWCVRLYTVIEIRRITARNAFIAEGLLTELVYKITNVISCTALQISNVISRTALQIGNVIIIIM